MATHRLSAPGAARPRYRRIGAAMTSLLVTMVAVLGAAGVLPTSTSGEPAHAAAVRAQSPHGNRAPQASTDTDQAVPTAHQRPPRHKRTAPRAPAPALPERSGQGKRIVFDMGAQRVWLVEGDGDVRRTYLVSGSLTDNLAAGRYEVYSKSLDAIGIDDSGTMRYMVRFAHGDYAAIGFHDIPIKDGQLVQTAAELGTPQSHGCIRQQRVDAKALWRFAPVGTEVVVLA